MPNIKTYHQLRKWGNQILPAGLSINSIKCYSAVSSSMKKRNKGKYNLKSSNWNKDSKNS